MEILLENDVTIHPNPGYTLYLYYKGDIEINNTCIFGVYMKVNNENVLVGKTSEFIDDSGKKLIILNVNLSESGIFSEFRLLCNNKLSKPLFVPDFGLIKIGNNTFTDLNKIPEIIF